MAHTDIVNTKLIRGILAGNYVTYISVPITTGRRYIEWMASNGGIHDAEQRYEKVVKPNVESAKSDVQRIRELTHHTVIDPTQLENLKLEWDQHHFYQFWDAVIKDVADEVVFLGGWEYSSGCCKELIGALESGKPIYTHDLEELTKKKAQELLLNAVKEYADIHITFDAAKDALEILKGMA